MQTSYNALQDLQDLVIENTEYEREKPIGDVVMIIEGSMRAPLEARAVYDVSDIVDEERAEPFPVRRIVLEISVLDD